VNSSNDSITFAVSVQIKKVATGEFHTEVVMLSENAAQSVAHRIDAFTSKGKKISVESILCTNLYKAL